MNISSFGRDNESHDYEVHCRKCVNSGDETGRLIDAVDITAATTTTCGCMEKVLVRGAAAGTDSNSGSTDVTQFVKFPLSTHPVE